jgi:hypothetical protein
MGFLAIPIGIGVYLFRRSGGNPKGMPALWIWFVTSFFYATLKSFLAVRNEGGLCGFRSAFHGNPCCIGGKLARDLASHFRPPALCLAFVDRFTRAGIHFEIRLAVPSLYSIITEFGSLDGKSICGPVRLERGYHEIRRSNGSGRLALLWARAAEQGCDPFYPVVPDVWTDQD